MLRFYQQQLLCELWTEGNMSCSCHSAHNRHPSTNELNEVSQELLAYIWCSIATILLCLLRVVVFACAVVLPAYVNCCGRRWLYATVALHSGNCGCLPVVVPCL